MAELGHRAVARSSIRDQGYAGTVEHVDAVFREQRRLSFTYGAVFLIVTLAIPAGSVWASWWYSSTIWGGFTPNYLVVSLLYYVFLWVIAASYARKADRLDARLRGEDPPGDGEES